MSVSVVFNSDYLSRKPLSKVDKNMYLFMVHKNT